MTNRAHDAVRHWELDELHRWENEGGCLGPVVCNDWGLLPEDSGEAETVEVDVPLPSPASRRPCGYDLPLSIPDNGLELTWDRPRAGHTPPVAAPKDGTLFARRTNPAERGSNRSRLRARSARPSDNLSRSF